MFGDTLQLAGIFILSDYDSKPKKSRNTNLHRRGRVQHVHDDRSSKHAKERANDARVLEDLNFSPEVAAAMMSPSFDAWRTQLLDGRRYHGTNLQTINFSTGRWSRGVSIAPSDPKYMVLRGDGGAKALADVSQSGHDGLPDKKKPRALLMPPTGCHVTSDVDDEVISTDKKQPAVAAVVEPFSVWPRQEKPVADTNYVRSDRIELVRLAPGMNIDGEYPPRRTANGKKFVPSLPRPGQVILRGRRAIQWIPGTAIPKPRLAISNSQRRKWNHPQITEQSEMAA